MESKKTGVTPAVGSIYQFGGFDWRVLDVQNNKALLITEKIIEQRAYHVEFTDITWENCTLREYLNGEFYNSLGAEKSAIAETRNENPDNPWYGTAGGRATTDKVFLLSLDELVKYFGDSGALRNKERYEWKNSKYVLSPNGYYLHDQYDEARKAHAPAGWTSWWWLRSPGGLSVDAVHVSHDGDILVGGDAVAGWVVGVRPALWLNSSR